MYSSAKSRLTHSPHNKGKKLTTYFGGRRAYISKTERFAGLAILTLTILISYGVHVGSGMPFNKIAGARTRAPIWAEPVLLSPIPQVGSWNIAYAAEPEVSPTPTPKPADPKDVAIGNAVDEFLPTRKSEARMIMHCLAHRESGHGASTAHGDNGKAGGPFQFWDDTWVRMRKQMIKQGHATEIGSRYDFNEAARTTAWALANGRAGEWGPIFREMKGSDFATCQKPSWYK